MATLVGYTNAGKSTLFNALSDAKVTAADQLFSTLDPVTRRIRLPSGAPLLLSDTVGFIQKLSPSVVAAFRATLEELSESDILLHVIDVTHPKAQEQTLVVQKTLKDLGLEDRPRLLVMNKMDLMVAQESGRADDIAAIIPNGQPMQEVASGILVSAAQGWNLDDLLHEIEELLISLDGPLTVVGSAGSN
jgi:GTP-binding protein HflX